MTVGLELRGGISLMLIIYRRDERWRTPTPVRIEEVVLIEGIIATPSTRITGLLRFKNEEMQ
jgi:hypothetical protein